MIKHRKTAILAAMAFLSVMVIVMSCEKPITPMNESPGPGFSALFNGTDFTGWDFGNYRQEDTSWSVVDGLMHCAGEPRNPYLVTTEKEYENYEFYAEFRVSKGCNSGIFHHVPLTGRQSKLGFETQILDDAYQPVNKNSTGSIYDVVPPLTNAMRRAGKWNQYHVIFDWPVCKVWLNDELVQDTDFEANPELRYRMRRGPLAVSNHGHVVDYRNLWIKELPDTDTGAEIYNGRDLSGWTVIGDADWSVRDGVLTSTRGEGYLVTEKEYEKVFFQAYVDSDTLRTRDACFHYRFKNESDPGYSVDMFDFIEAKRFTEQYGKRIPADVIPPMTSPWFLYRIVSADRESKAWLNEYVISENRLLGKDPRGKIAIYRGSEDGIIRIKGMILRELDGPGI